MPKITQQNNINTIPIVKLVFLAYNKETIHLKFMTNLKVWQKVSTATKIA